MCGLNTAPTAIILPKSNQKSIKKGVLGHLEVLDLVVLSVLSDVVSPLKSLRHLDAERLCNLLYAPPDAAWWSTGSHVDCVNYDAAATAVSTTLTYFVFVLTKCKRA